MLYWTISVPPALDVGHAARRVRARRRSLVLNARTPMTMASKRASARAASALVVEQRDVVADAPQARRHLVARAGEVADRACRPSASAQRHEPRPSASAKPASAIGMCACSMRTTPRASRAASRSRRRRAAAPGARACRPGARAHVERRALARRLARASENGALGGLDRPARAAARAAASRSTLGAPAAARTATVRARASGNMSTPRRRASPRRRRDLDGPVALARAPDPST